MGSDCISSCSLLIFFTLRIWCQICIFFSLVNSAIDTKLRYRNICHFVKTYKSIYNDRKGRGR